MSKWIFPLFAVWLTTPAQFLKCSIAAEESGPLPEVAGMMSCSRLMSDGKVSLPALGIGMGDVVLANLIDDTPHAQNRMETWIAQSHAADIFIVIAKEERRPDALTLVQQLRDDGLRVDFLLTALKVGKQFQAADQAGASLVILVGEEWPQVKIKVLATRQEEQILHTELADWLRNRQKSA